jgi:hypothetical protein
VHLLRDEVVACLSPLCKIRRHRSDDEKGLCLASGADKIVEGK